MKDYMETEYDSNFSITPFSLDSQHSSSTRNETASANWRGSQSIYVGGKVRRISMASQVNATPFLHPSHNSLCFIDRKETWLWILNDLILYISLDSKIFDQ